MLTVLPLLFVSACSPWADVAAREAVWWGPASELEAALDLELVPLSGGEPVGRWPRVVVREDRIDIDNRAWFLSLPPEVFEATPTDELRSLLVEEEGVVRVSDGRVAPGDKRGRYITALATRLEAMGRAQRAFQEDHGLEITTNVLIVPEASVPGETLAEVSYTLGAALLGTIDVAGVHEGRVRRGMMMDLGLCALDLSVSAVGDGRVRISPLHIDGPNACVPPDDASTLLANLADTCAVTWDEVGAAVFAQYPGVEAVEDWQCVALVPSGGQGPYRPVLQVTAATLAHYPRVRQQPMAGWPPDRSCPTLQPSAADFCLAEHVEEGLLAVMDAHAAGLDHFRRWHRPDRRHEGAIQQLLEHLRASKED